MRLAKRFGKEIETDEYYRFSKLSKEKEKVSKLNKERILDLGIGDPNTFPPRSVIEEIKKSIDLDNVHGYSDNGIVEFRYKVSNYLGVSYNQVNHTMGTKEALCILGLMFISKNDYIITTKPCYNILDNMNKWLGGRTYYLPLLKEKNYEVDLDNIPKYVLKRTKLMYLNYPNNPTSKLATRELYLKALKLAKKYNFMVVNDNAYGDLIFEEKDVVNFRDVEGFNEYGIELSTFSKAYNMTGYRIGYILSNERVIRVFQNVKDNLDSGQFIPIQMGAIKALDSYKFLVELKEKYYNRQIRLHTLLTKYGFEYELPKAGFFAYISIPKYIDGVAMTNAYKCSMYLLKHHRIMTIPYDVENDSHIRLSLTFKEDEDNFFNELENRLKRMKIKF